MKLRFFSLLSIALFPLMLLCCSEDTPPEKTVGNITFVITEENTPQTLSEVSIQLTFDDDPSVTPSNRTDDVGRCTFYNIPIGSYHVGISKPGYESKTGLTLKINSGDNPKKELSLKRATTELTIAPTLLDFGDNESVIQKAFSLTNPNYVDLTWAVLDTDVPWILSVCDKDGKKSGIIKYNQEVAMSVTIDRDKLSNGDNESTIIILSDYGRAELKIKAVGADRRMASLNALPATNIQRTCVTLNAEVISKGAPEYTERGFVLSTAPIAEDASISGLKKLDAEMNNDLTYSVDVVNLVNGVHYYVRAYAINDIGTKLSNQIEFTTVETLTVVNTKDVKDLDVINGTAIFVGEITIEGNPKYTEKGFVYNTSGEPTINNTKRTVSGSGDGIYTYSCAGLSSMTTYYVRAYAIQNGAVIYGTTVNFSTNQDATEVATSGATNVTATSATLNGSITKVGIPEFTEKGFCYSSTNTKPTISDTKKVVTGNNTGSYSLTINGLSIGETYYYRAYALQNGTPVYGEIVSFATEFTETEVSTSGATNVTPSTATLNGSISVVGSPEYTEKGFCYSTSSSNPTINNTKIPVSGSGSGNYSYNLSGLSYNTTYYYRAYAIQNGSTIYGSVVNFNTGYTATVVETNSNVTNIKYDQATIGFAIRNVGDPACTEAGICYGTSSSPTISSNKVSGVANATYNQSKTITGLSENTTYYFRAYAMQNGAPVYGTAFSFKTAERPSVSTLAYSNLQNTYGLMNMWQVQLNGEVNSVGNPPINGRGFKYSTSGDPEKSGTTVSASGSSTGQFSASLTGMKSNTTYYIRAYVKNSLGYEYGGLITITTGD